MNRSWIGNTLNLGALAAMVAAPGLLVTTVAHAAGGGLATVDQSVLRYSAVPSDVNQVVITQTGSSIVIDDRVFILAGQGCIYPDGNDQTVVRCNGSGVSNIVIFGGDRDDSIDNLLSQTDGELHGGTGNDSLRGSDSGNDTLFGDDGNDNLAGQSLADRVFGGNGADNLAGWRGNDELDGGPGNDFVVGEQGNDRVIGDSGEDMLRGDDGDDHLIGNADNDNLDGGSGNNRLNGGGGIDTCRNGPDIVFCER